MPPPSNQQQRPTEQQQPQPSTSNVYNVRPTPNVLTVPFGASGTSLGAAPKAADRFRAKTAVIPLRQEHRQGSQTRPPGGERFAYREQRQVLASNDYGLGQQLPVTDAFRQGRLMQAIRRFTQQPTNKDLQTNTYSQVQTEQCQECKRQEHNKTTSGEDH
jgi:hypothetical protein